MKFNLQGDFWNVNTYKFIVEESTTGWDILEVNTLEDFLSFLEEHGYDETEIWKRKGEWYIGRSNY